MENNEENIFRKFIQKTKPETPDVGFSDLVMKLVEAEIAAELSGDEAIKKLLGHEILTENPSQNFTKMVMDQAIVPLIKPAAIISKRSWYMIAASVLLAITYCVFAFTPEVDKHVSSGMDVVLTGISGKLDRLPVIYPVTIFAMSILLFGDYLLQYGKTRKMLWI